MNTKTVICDYCGDAAELVTGRDVYPYRPDLYSKKIYRCVPCNALVGCHEGTETPLGRLANPELRKAKMAAHAAFDPIWKGGHKKRGSAYAWLRDQLGISKDACHIGMFDVAMCNKVITICNNFIMSDEIMRWDSNDLIRN